LFICSLTIGSSIFSTDRIKAAGSSFIMPSLLGFRRKNHRKDSNAGQASLPPDPYADLDFDQKGIKAWGNLLLAATGHLHPANLGTIVSFVYSNVSGHHRWRHTYSRQKVQGSFEVKSCASNDPGKIDLLIAPPGGKQETFVAQYRTSARPEVDYAWRSYERLVWYSANETKWHIFEDKSAGGYAYSMFFKSSNEPTGNLDTPFERVIDIHVRWGDARDIGTSLQYTASSVSHGSSAQHPTTGSLDQPSDEQPSGTSVASTATAPWVWREGRWHIEYIVDDVKYYWKLLRSTTALDRYRR
jgi:hypothetical protein